MSWESSEKVTSSGNEDCLIFLLYNWIQLDICCDYGRRDLIIFTLFVCIVTEIVSIRKTSIFTSIK